MLVLQKHKRNSEVTFSELSFENSEIEVNDADHQKEEKEELSLRSIKGLPSTKLELQQSTIKVKDLFQAYFAPDFMYSKQKDGL